MIEEDKHEIERLRGRLDQAIDMWGKDLDAKDVEIQKLHNLLAECFPLVRPGTDLSRRIRNVLSER